MPWQKSFDEDQAVGRAMTVFWQKGFESASIADLIEGTGITRGSLYNAFGDKEKLFIKALRKYDLENRHATLAEFRKIDDPRSSISTLFATIVTETTTDPAKKGCFIINTAAELTIHGEEVCQIVGNGLSELEAFFKHNIALGQARQEIAKDLDPESTAKALLGMIVAIRLLGRGTYDKTALSLIADQAMRLLD